ncbi:hypothetical protein GALL_255850 [mine drainage metagenome]|uniref:Uncharacterized protein n=1 Tax=mine drainage metagenome TaxID=410659 RepID=A0A1J5R912_9ZZZZ
MPAHSVSRLAQPFETRRPFTRRPGALASNTGTPKTIAAGWRRDSAMNAGMRSAGCWPSESMVNTWLYPAAAACSRP